MKSVVVFGATGDIGRYFINGLLEGSSSNEYKIIAVGRKDHKEVEKKWAGDVDYIQLDITKKNTFNKLPKKIYAIVDFAGLMPARMEGYHPQKYIDTNITGTLNILEYAIQASADRILFMQSFGDIKSFAEKNIILANNLPRKFGFKNDHTVYVMTKNFAVDLIEHYHLMYGIKKFIFRLPTIYLMSEIDTYFVDGKERKIGYRKIIEMACNGDTIEIWGDKNRVKDMIYVKDFCQMLYRALQVEKDSGYYNVGTGIGTTLIDQIKGIINVFGHENCLRMCPEKPDAPQYIMDISEARNDLGYSPQYDYLSMLNDMKKERERMLGNNEK